MDFTSLHLLGCYIVISSEMYFLMCEICYTDFYVSGWQNHLFSGVAVCFQREAKRPHGEYAETKDTRTGTELIIVQGLFKSSLSSLSGCLKDWNIVCYVVVWGIWGLWQCQTKIVRVLKSKLFRLGDISRVHPDIFITFLY